MNELTYTPNKSKPRKSLVRSPMARKGKRLRTKGESPEEREWKLKVRERDNYTCQRCFKVTLKSIHCHHIAPRSRRPDLVLELSNGIALCFECHAWCHARPIEATKAGFLSDASYEKAKRDLVEVG